MTITNEIAAQLGLSESQAAAINNMFAFVKFKTISELQEAEDPFDGYFPIDKGGGELEKIKASVFYQLIGNVAKPLAPNDPSPTAIGWYKPQIYSDSPGTNYPNAGNLKAINGYDTLFYFDGTTWKKTDPKLPGDVEKVITYSTVVRFLNKKSITKVTLSNNVNYTYEGSLAVLNSTEVHEIIPNGYSVTFDSIFTTKIQSDIDYSKPISIVFNKPLSSNLKPLAIVVNISEIDNTIPLPKYKVNPAGDVRLSTWFEYFEFPSHIVGANDCVFNIGLYNTGGVIYVVGNFTLVGQGATGRWANFTIPESQWEAGKVFIPDGTNNIVGVKVKMGNIKPTQLITGNTADFTLIPV